MYIILGIVRLHIRILIKTYLFSLLVMLLHNYLFHQPPFVYTLFPILSSWSFSGYHDFDPLSLFLFFPFWCLFYYPFLVCFFPCHQKIIKLYWDWLIDWTDAALGLLIVILAVKLSHMRILLNSNIAFSYSWSFFCSLSKYVIRF